MKNIWFIRHGQSESNAGVITIHPAITAITENGKLQSKYLADYIQTKPDLIIHSPFKRSRLTAQYVIDKFPEATVEQWPVHEFTYLSPEKYHNTTRHERKQFVTRYWQRCDPDYKDSQEAESFNEFISRVISCYQKLSMIDDQVFVVTHGHFMRAIIWMILLGKGNDYYNMQKYRSLREALSVANAAILKTRITAEPAEMSSLITHFIPDSLRT